MRENDARAGLLSSAGPPKNERPQPAVPLPRSPAPDCGLPTAGRDTIDHMSESTCTHIDAIESVKTAVKHECEECVKTGSRWVHLRTCQTCGVTLCCDSSPNRHASKHARSSQHPVIASAERGERWLYCFPDDAFVEY